MSDLFEKIIEKETKMAHLRKMWGGLLGTKHGVIK